MDWYFYPLEKKSYDLPITIRYSSVVKDDFLNAYSYEEKKKIEEEKFDYFADENESLEGETKFFVFLLKYEFIYFFCLFLFIQFIQF